MGNMTVQHCTDGVEEWTGDITGIGTYSYDRIINLTTGVRVVVNGVETIEDAWFLPMPWSPCGASSSSHPLSLALIGPIPVGSAEK
jgi:hypothetical protein